jgi:hypothetical protein
MRESFSILNWWRYPKCIMYFNKKEGKYKYRNKYLIKILSILYLFKKVIISNYERKYFITDNFIYPIKKLRCYLSHHEYIFDDTNTCTCFRCNKEISRETYNNYIRIKKIKSIF